MALRRERSHCPPCPHSRLAKALDPARRCDRRARTRTKGSLGPQPPIRHQRLADGTAGKLSRCDRLRVTSKGSRTKRRPIGCGAPSAPFAAGSLGAGQCCKERLNRTGLAPARRAPAHRPEPVEPMPAPAMRRPSTCRLDRPDCRQTRQRRAHLSHRSSSNRRTRNRSDPNHDNLQDRVGRSTRRFHRLVGLGRSRIGCPDPEALRLSKRELRRLHRPETPPVGPDHRIRAFRSGGNRSAQRSGRRARSFRSPTTYLRSSSASSPKSAPRTSIPKR